MVLRLEVTIFFVLNSTKQTLNQIIESKYITPYQRCSNNQILNHVIRKEIILLLNKMLTML
jgi:hypothetical protein